MSRVERHEDKLVWWIVSGLLATAAQDVYSYSAKLVGITDTLVWDVAASLAVSEAEAGTVAALIVGCLIDTVIGGLLGIVIGLLLEWRGTRDYIIKGLVVGLVAWVCFYGIAYHNLPYTAERDLVDVSTMISASVGHVIYGAVAATVYVKWLSRYVNHVTD